MWAGSQEAIEVCRKHPDRLIPFCNIDPRAILNHRNADFGPLMRIFKDLGCRGVGEICANLPITHNLCKNLFRHASEEQLPVLFHLTAGKGKQYGLVDKLGLPGLEEVLKELPKTIFIGHAPAFWNEIDGNLKPGQRNGYPAGPISSDGRLWQLMSEYPNLYADISAGSGANALNRDPEAGFRFMKTFSKKVFFGTDCFFVKSEPPPQIPLMQNALADKKITKSAYDNIMFRNFERVFGKS